MTHQPLIEQFDREVSRARAQMSTQVQGVRILLRRAGARSNDRLPRPLKACVMGELNSGKSSLVNAMLGKPVLPASVAAHTRLPVRNFYARKPTLFVETASGKRIDFTTGPLNALPMDEAVMVHAGWPIARLRRLELIDMPPHNPDDAAEQPGLRQVLGQSHFAIWCTPAVQAWKASEAAAWQAMPERLRSNGILAVTFKDKVGEDDQKRLWTRIGSAAAPRFKSAVLVSLRAGIPAPAAGVDELRRAIDEGRARVRLARSQAVRSKLPLFRPSAAPRVHPLAV